MIIVESGAVVIRVSTSPTDIVVRGGAVVTVIVDPDRHAMVEVEGDDSATTVLAGARAHGQLRLAGLLSAGELFAESDTFKLATTWGWDL